MNAGGNRQGRWLTPDPMGGDITNPQSLNRYAYALNNPTTLTDPSGLITRYCPMVDTVDNCAGGMGGGNDFGGYTIDGQSVPGSVGQAALNGGFGCIGSCTSTVVGSNGKPYTVVQTAGTPDIYAPNGELLYPDGESVAEVGLQNAGKAVYPVFSAMCLNQGCDPNQSFPVRYQFANGVYNVTWNGHTLNTNNLAGYWKDPFTFLHNGYPSWFQGSPLSLFDVMHLIGGPVLTGHEDPFGPLNPLHYLIQLPQMLVPAGNSFGGSCSVAGGRILGH